MEYNSLRASTNLGSPFPMKIKMRRQLHDRFDDNPFPIYKVQLTNEDLSLVGAPVQGLR